MGVEHDVSIFKAVNAVDSEKGKGGRCIGVMTWACSGKTLSYQCG